MLFWKPRIFISAVTSELSGARETVAVTLRKFGYDAVYQTEFITQPGKLLDYLSRLIDKSDLVIQLVGDKYGAEPLSPTTEFGRCSYTQFELFYAEKRKKKIVVIECDGDGVRDPAKAVRAVATAFPEPLESSVSQASQEKLGDDEPERRVPGRDDPISGLKTPGEAEQIELQRQYRNRIKNVGYKREKVGTQDRLEITVMHLRTDIDKLRRQAVWLTTGIALLVVAGLGVGVWSLFENRHGFNRLAGTIENLKTNGRLQAQGDQPGAVMFMPGQPSLPLPLKLDLPPGPRQLTFHASGYLPVFFDVTLLAGKTENLGTIHFQPVETKFDDAKTYDLQAVQANPWQFLDREFWVTASVVEPTGPPKVARSGDGATYTYFFLCAPDHPVSNPHHYIYLDSGTAPPGLMHMPDQPPLALGRLRPEQAGKLRDALKPAQEQIRRQCASDEAERMARRKEQFDKERAALVLIAENNARYERRRRGESAAEVTPAPITEPTLRATMKELSAPVEIRVSAEHPTGRIKVRLGHDTFVPGSENFGLGGYAFLCDVIAWSPDWSFADTGNTPLDTDTRPTIGANGTPRPGVALPGDPPGSLPTQVKLDGGNAMQPQVRVR